MDAIMMIVGSMLCEPPPGAEPAAYARSGKSIESEASAATTIGRAKHQRMILNRQRWVQKHGNVRRRGARWWLRGRDGGDDGRARRQVGGGRGGEAARRGVPRRRLHAEQGHAPFGGDPPLDRQRSHRRRGKSAIES